MSIIDHKYQYLLVVADRLSMSHAAEVLRINQGALSRTIQAIEAELGQRIFVRHNRGLGLTSFGEHIVNETRSLVNKWDEAVREGHEKRQTVSGLFRIGSHVTVAQNILPRYIPALIDEFPKLEFQFEFLNSFEVVRKVLSHDLDFGVVVNPKKNNELVIHQLDQEQVGIWRSGRTKSEPTVLYYHPEMIDVESILEKYTHLRLSPIRSYMLCANFTASGKGLGVLPAGTAKRFADLKLVESYYDASICLVYRSDINRSMGARAIIQKFRSTN